MAKIKPGEIKRRVRLIRKHLAGEMTHAELRKLAKMGKSALSQWKFMVRHASDEEIERVMKGRMAPFHLIKRLEFADRVESRKKKAAIELSLRGRRDGACLPIW